MAIDLADLVESIEREVNSPGNDAFPDAVEDDWVGHLRDAFWEAKLFGFFASFTESDGLISPISPTGDDMDRQNQQLVVLFAAVRIIRNEMKNTSTMFRAKAGPVEFETQSSANLLRDVLAEIKGKITYILGVLGTLNTSTTYYIDSVFERTESILYGDSYVWG